MIDTDLSCPKCHEPIGVVQVTGFGCIARPRRFSRCVLYQSTRTCCKTGVAQDIKTACSLLLAAIESNGKKPRKP